MDKRASLSRGEDAKLTGCFRVKGRMVSEEKQEKVDAAVEKYLAGEKLTDKEWTLLAYTWFAAGCSSCGGKH